MTCHLIMDKVILRKLSLQHAANFMKTDKSANRLFEQKKESAPSSFSCFLFMILVYEITLSLSGKIMIDPDVDLFGRFIRRKTFSYQRFELNSGTYALACTSVSQYCWQFNRRKPYLAINGHKPGRETVFLVIVDWDLRRTYTINFGREKHRRS